MHRRTASTVALLLLGIFAAGFRSSAFGLTHQELSVPAASAHAAHGHVSDEPASDEPAAGCHDHAPAPAMPVPVSYRCCVSGHNAAIPATAFSGQSPLSFLSLIAAPGQNHPVTEQRESILPGILFSPQGASPGSSPLRV